MKDYAGIGARKTPTPVLIVMGSIAAELRRRGYRLRSGGARGADRAFEVDAHPHCKIYRSFDATPAAFDHAAKFHPQWEACDADAMALHARNSLVLLTETLADPVDFVVCWTPGGKVVGGTGQALRIAEAYNIPVFNLFNDPNAFDLMSWVNAH